MLYSPKIEKLIQSFKCLPGIGNKSAQRMVFNLLEQNRNNAQILANSILDAVKHVNNCNQCYILTEHSTCQICNNPKREQSTLCIVENPSDVLAIENTGSYKGMYFVLLGRLSPIDGIGPDEIGIPKLIERLQSESIKEIIIATNSTTEGEATAHYISVLAKKYDVLASRIAHGIPIGGELEYIDSNTISQAISYRSTINL
ncbi:MAG: recombination protein RecR [Legionellales bacterium]|nr:recombination protein RecR [Legionellales bacterium]